MAPGPCREWVPGPFCVPHQSEVRLDYEDFLRQRGLAQWPPDHPSLQRFKARRCASMEDMRNWRNAELALQSGNKDNHRNQNTDSQERTRTRTDGHGPTPTGPIPDRPPSVSVGGGPCQSVLSAQLEANGALSLLNLCCYLLDRQLAAQAAAFERHGGFAERPHGRHRVERALGLQKGTQAATDTPSRTDTDPPNDHQPIGRPC